MHPFLNIKPDLGASFFVFFITVILCLVGGLVLSVFSKNRVVNNRWLAAYYLFAGYGLLAAFQLQSGVILEFPGYYTYRTGYIAGFLIMPFSFFYIRSLIQQKKFRLFDMIHFVPAIVFIVDFMPFYLKPASYKIQQLTADMQNLNTVWAQFSQGWLGIGPLYVHIRILLVTFYWIWQVLIIIRSGKIEGARYLLSENRHIITWAIVLCASQVIFFVPYYINLISGNQVNPFFVNYGLIAVGISLTIVYLMFHPAILYGLKGTYPAGSAGRL